MADLNLTHCRSAVRGFFKVRLRRLVLLGTLAGMLCVPVARAQQQEAQASAAKKVLYVTRLQHRDRVIDDKVRAYLEKRGLSVTMVDQTTPSSAALGNDLVIISSVVSARDLAGTSYKDVSVPLLTWEADLFDSLRFTGAKKGEDFGEVEKEHYINVVNAPSPLAGGVPAGKRWVYPRDDEMGWGKPAPGATVIATIPGEPQHAVVFAYEKGATMDYDFIAPARRVALFLGNRTFEKLSPDGTALFDAALDWAISTDGAAAGQQRSDRTGALE
ncbi:hypothetical protein [Paraburkholderia lacunae]|uniref:DUF4136 domain-containing protein n=1 Tax=Paraburkholderia lacunae TaxID=2211104 RepID=A0A370N5G4_9BURK|nr:hypothetical protein [Paraburkholderia lacunae]RDK00864.1 hypothetical protein DLM46_21235 [Paraburkholderia lacunae]